MSEHYFTRRPAAPHRPLRVRFTLGKTQLWLHTDRGVFSYRHVDPGTRLLAEAFLPDGARRVVDLGAGYGALGLMLAARFPGLWVVMVEINERAAELCRRNAQENGLAAPVVVGDGLSAFSSASFDAVVTNPPVRAGRGVIYRWMEEAARVLVLGGSFWMVVRTRQGAATLAEAARERVGPVELVERGGGYRVFRARKLRGRMADGPPDSGRAGVRGAEDGRGGSLSLESVP